MPRYRYVGFHEMVLHGLAHAVNAVLHRPEDEDGNPHGQPDESTVVVLPGDEVTTTEPYPHALLEELDPDAAPPKVKKPRAPRGPKLPDPAPADVPVVPASGQE